MRAPEPLMRMEEVGRSYAMGGGEVHALRGISLRVARGEYVAIKGPSGSGKSTLLHLLGCLDRPSHGRYWLDGRRVDALSDAELSRVRNRTMGFVFQSFHLIPQLTIAENVEVPLLYRGVEAAERMARAARVLDRVGLARRHGHRPNELSGGECQRVAIARALVGEPELILADEPTGNLDSRTGEEVMRILEGLNRDGVTIVLVTHDLDKAMRAGRLLEMRDGRLDFQWEKGSRARSGSGPARPGVSRDAPRPQPAPALATAAPAPPSTPRAIPAPQPGPAPEAVLDPVAQVARRLGALRRPRGGRG